MRRAALGMFLIAFVHFLSSFSTSAQVAKQPMDRLLVLAMDVSYSINDARFALQIKGYAEAFRDPETIRAITSGPHGSVAITMAQWSGWGEYSQTVPWTVIRTAEDGRKFAKLIEESGRKYSAATSISWAILTSAKLIDEAPYTAPRSVIDISGDGPDDDTMRYTGMAFDSESARRGAEAIAKGILERSGASSFVPLPKARSQVCGAGIEVNGLAIEGAEDVDDLASYYRAHVICRKGAFVIRVEDPESYEEFSRAIIRKIRHELSF